MKGWFAWWPIRSLTPGETGAALLLLLGILVCTLGLGKLQTSMEDVVQWLPDQSPQRAIYNRFTEVFGTDDWVILSWPGAKVGDERIGQFQAAVAEADELGLIRSTTSGPGLLDQLTQRGLDREEIRQRFSGLLFGPEGETTCVLVQLSEAGQAQRTEVLELLRQQADGLPGLSRDEIILAGYPALGSAADEAIREMLLTVVVPSAVVATLLAWWCLGRLATTLAVLAVAGLATMVSVALVPLTGSTFGGLSSAIPTLIYVITLSGGLHLVNYYQQAVLPALRDEIDHHAPKQRKLLAHRLFLLGWKPCLVSALSTAVGLLALCRSDFPAIRNFGFYAAIGTLVSLALQLGVLPVLLPWLVNQRQDVHLPRFLPWLQRRAFRRVLRGRAVVLGFCVVLLAVMMPQLLRLRTVMDTERHFPADSRILQDVRWLEENIGPLEPTEVVLAFEDHPAETFPERLALVRHVEADLQALPQIAGVYSLTDYLPAPPDYKGTLAWRRHLYEQRLTKAADELTSNGYLSRQPEGELWRVSLRSQQLGEMNAEALAEQVTAAVHESLDRYFSQYSAENAPPRPEVTFTGMSVLYHQGQKHLVYDLFLNFGTAFLFIVPLLMIALWDWKLGLVALIPNIIPSVVVFGAIGLFDYPLELSIAITASLALGIAVDDTAHFLTRFQTLSRDHSHRLMALWYTYRECSAAMIFTTLVAGLGMFIFIFGPLVSLVRFAIVLLALLLVALASDLLVLPVLLTMLKTRRSSATPDPAPVAQELETVSSP